MNIETLFWIYLINAIILINHEIDSAYWQEWKLINPNDEKGIAGFLILHFPMLFVILYGLILVERGTFIGLIISLTLSAGGIFAFFFHFHFIRKGRPEFNSVISKSIIISTFIVSVVQLMLTVKLMMFP